MSPEFIAQLPTQLSFYVIFLFAISVHEAAHAWMSLQCGDTLARDENRISLNPLVHIDPIGTVLIPLGGLLIAGLPPLIGWARPVPVNMGALRRPSDMMWIALAGPISNLILAVWTLVLVKISFMVAPLLGSTMQSWGAQVQFDQSFLLYLLMLNLFLAMFNMIPVPPLDGSRVLFFTVVANRPWLRRAWEVVENYGFLLLLLLVITGAFHVVMLPLISYLFVQIILLLT